MPYEAVTYGEVLANDTALAQVRAHLWQGVTAAALRAAPTAVRGCWHTRQASQPCHLRAAAALPARVQLHAKGVRGIGPYKNTLVAWTPTYDIDASVSGWQAE